MDVDPVDADRRRGDELLLNRLIFGLYMDLADLRSKPHRLQGRRTQLQCLAQHLIGAATTLAGAEVEIEELDQKWVLLERVWWWSFQFA